MFSRTLKKQNKIWKIVIRYFKNILKQNKTEKSKFPEKYVSTKK